MKEYIFVLGNTPRLARAEIRAVFKREKIPHKLIFFFLRLLCLSSSPLPVERLIRTLGGTVKIVEVIKKIKLGKQKDPSQFLTKKLVNLLFSLVKKTNSKITFGLSGYGEIGFSEIYNLSEKIKDSFKKKGLKSRFVLPRKDKTLSSVVVAKQRLLEINIILKNKELIIGKTLAVQDFEDWGRRDYGRPFADPKRGMLPPKVARMMVNIAIANNTLSTRPEAGGQAITDSLILDPFCGMGTILMEGLMMGVNVIGSDQSKEAIKKTRKNLDWLISSYNLSANYQLFISEATHISEKIGQKTSVWAVVTEPFMGPLFKKIPKREKAKRTILGLEKLYIGALKNWKKLLKPKGKVVIIFPSIETESGEITVKKIVDNCENLGYNFLAGPYTYAREKAIVKRNVFIFEPRRPRVLPVDEAGEFERRIKWRILKREKLLKAQENLKLKD